MSDVSIKKTYLQDEELGDSVLYAVRKSDSCVLVTPGINNHILVIDSQSYSDDVDILLVLRVSGKSCTQILNVIRKLTVERQSLNCLFWDKSPAKLKSDGHLLFKRIECDSIELQAGFKRFVIDSPASYKRYYEIAKAALDKYNAYDVAVSDSDVWETVDVYKSKNRSVKPFEVDKRESIMLL